jgi:hypothetical protein
MRKKRKKSKIELLRERNKRLLKGQPITTEKILDKSVLIKCCVCGKPLNKNTAKYLGKDNNKWKKGAWRHQKCVVGGKEWMRNNVGSEFYKYWSVNYTEKELKEFERIFYNKLNNV